MNINDYFGGSALFGFPKDAHGGLALANELLLVPASREAVGPVCVVSYAITQMPAGNGVALLFYDAATLPVDGTPLFDNTDPTQTPVMVLPIGSTGAAATFQMAPPASHPYFKGFGVIVNSDTTFTSVARAAALCSIVVSYLPSENP